MKNLEKYTLFDSDERYTDDALAIDNEVNVAVSAIFKKWLAQGYKVREITGLLHAAVDTAGCFQILELDVKLK